jgi:hypothetical protein
MVGKDYCSVYAKSTYSDKKCQDFKKFQTSTLLPQNPYRKNFCTMLCNLFLWLSLSLRKYLQLFITHTVIKLRNALFNGNEKWPI